MDKLSPVASTPKLSLEYYSILLTQPATAVRRIAFKRGTGSVQPATTTTTSRSQSKTALIRMGLSTPSSFGIPFGMREISIAIVSRHGTTQVLSSRPTPDTPIAPCYSYLYHHSCLLVGCFCTAAGHKNICRT